MAVKAPTFIQEAETSWNPGANVASQEKSFAVKVGDWIVLYVMNEEGGKTLAYSVAGGGLTWNQLKINSKENWGYIAAWSAKATKEETITVKVSATGQNQYTHIGVWGFDALTFRGSEGIGAVELFTGEGAPKGSLTTLSDESVVVVANNDWNNLSGTRTWRTINGITPTSGNGLETSFFNASGIYTIYGAYYTSAGKAGAKEVGLSAPTGQKWAMIAVEVKGTAEAEGKALKLELSDSVKAKESFAKGVGKTAADTAKAKEQLGKAAAKVRSDSVTASSSFAKAVTKARADTATTSDSLRKAAGKVAADVAHAAEALVKGIRKAATDSATAKEKFTPELHTTKLPCLGEPLAATIQQRSTAAEIIASANAAVIVPAQTSAGIGAVSSEALIGASRTRATFVGSHSAADIGPSATNAKVGSC